MDDEQRYVLIILHRAATELDLHCQLILEPVLQTSRLGAKHGTRVKVSKEAQTRGEKQALERLVGYAAWCLDQDHKHLVEAKATLGRVYDGADARALARDERALSLHEALYGDLDIENQHELDRQRQQHESLLEHQLTWVARWCAVEEIQRWLKEFKRRRSAQRLGAPHTIFTLLGAKTDSVRGRLAELDVDFAYTQYAHASQLLHGSSALHFVRHSTDELGPDFGLANGYEEAMVRGIADKLSRTTVNLDYLKRKLRPPPRS
jgi:hypothetical protein